MIAPTIFQVEDDEDFSFFMEQAIREINNNISLTIATNGQKGMRLLKRYQENNGIPGMILLDLNLPGMSGIDILRLIRDTPFYSKVPVIIFSTSDNPKDVQTAMQSGASEFKTKPLGYRELLNDLKSLHTKYVNT
ncbi:MAG: response regulator [Pedobacter sp.]|nr:MAG: response regulator [Pedobacter sp.]